MPSLKPKKIQNSYNDRIPLFLVCISEMLHGGTYAAGCFLTTTHTTTRHTPFSLPRKDNQLHATKTSNINSVHIYDGVFTPTACLALKDLSFEHNERSMEHDSGVSDGSSIFRRPPHNTHKLTPLEHAMHSVLTEMGEELASTAYVEYWSRDEYMHIDAHADIDEVEFEMLDSDTSALRCPMMGHVLYLDVLREELYGPTCVFPGTNIGWDYKYKYNNNNNYDEQTRARTSYNGTKEQGVELVTVPAVQGRVLRFPGSAMHAVPKPAHRWLLSDEENDRLTKLDEDDDDDDEESRAVLLFNTWREPPQGVSGDYATGVMPDGIELDEEDMQEHIASLEEEFYSEWEEEYGVDAERVLCKPQCEWKEVEIQEHDHSNCNGSSETEGEAQVVRIGLMGKKERRVYAGSNVRLRGPFESVRSALEEKSIPTRFHLSEEEQESKET